MGLSIHYSGSFNPSASLREMIEEVKDVCEIYQWKYFVFDEEFPVGCFSKEAYNQDIYGISFTPPKCETVSLSFLSNGKMSCLPNLQFFGNSTDEEEAQYLYMLSVKTQYAGIEIHKLLVHLLKYLNKKYFLDFIVNDEGEYWETGDEKLLQDTFNRFSFFIENFATSIENYPIQSRENFEDYFKRLMEYIHKNKFPDSK